MNPNQPPTSPPDGTRQLHQQPPQQQPFPRASPPHSPPSGIPAEVTLLVRVPLNDAPSVEITRKFRILLPEQRPPRGWPISIPESLVFIVTVPPQESQLVLDINLSLTISPDQLILTKRTVSVEPLVKLPEESSVTVIMGVVLYF